MNLIWRPVIAVHCLGSVCVCTDSTCTVQVRLTDENTILKMYAGIAWCFLSRKRLMKTHIFYFKQETPDENIFLILSRERLMKIYV